MTKPISRKEALLSAVAGCAVLWASTAATLAGSGSSSLAPGALLLGTCYTATFSTPVTIPYDPIVTNLSSPATGTRILNLTCSLGTIATIDLDHGVNAIAAGSYFWPNMIGTGASPDRLAYGVYQDSVFTLLWGTTTSLDGTVPGTAVTYTSTTGSTTSSAVTLYIRIPANQNVQADTYTDTLTATVAY